MTQTRKYASVLAKIGAERSKFLSDTKIKGLAESKTLTDIVGQLRDTSYQEQIAHITPPLTCTKLERAFYENLIETVIKIMEYSPEKSANYLQLVLLRFEIEHIKGILKGTAAKLTAEQKLAKIHFAVEDQLERHFIIEDAAKASTVTQVVQTFKGTDYWSPLSMGLKSYEQSGSTASLDVFIDKYYYEKIYETFESLPKKEKKYAKFYASMDNDSFTLLTLVRGKILNFDPNWLRLVVPQNYFNLKKQTVEALVSAADYEAAMKIVLGTPYSSYFNRAQDPQETVANAEKAFNKAILQHAKASQIREIFNIGLVLSFLTQKEAEIHNLAVVCLGVEGAMKPEDIRSQFLL